MFKGKATLAILSALVILALLAMPVLAAPGDTTRVSVATDGTQGNGDSWEAAISPNGRYVGFNSYANDLLGGAAHGACNVFVHDRQTGATTVVSVASDGTLGNACSEVPSFSGDEHYVGFQSQASNLVPGDTNGVYDAFMHDQQTGSTERVSLSTGGQQGNGNSFSPTFSANGRYAAFTSDASNLVPGDTNGTFDVFVRDQQAGTTIRASVAWNGVQANGPSGGNSLSADGRYVAFLSWAQNLVAGGTAPTRQNAYVRDLQTGTTTLVSVASDGTPGNAELDEIAISADGRIVTFMSGATNLVPGDTNNTFDIFVHDMQTGETRRASVNSKGVQSNGWSEAISISGDGRYVAFYSWASNLVPGDTNDARDIFVHDMQTGATVRASVASDGRQANDISVRPSISADGHFVAFESLASNLVTGDTNEAWDIFVHELDVTPVVPTPTANPTPTALPTSTAAPAPKAMLPSTGFAPGHVTILPLPVSSFLVLGDLWLEVPQLDIQMPIVGVPFSNGNWDVSWLGKQAGWLNGSAFPTWAGNSVLTGHVWNADNTPGPFVYLNQLWWGDKVIVHAGGAQYVYEVRSVQQVSPADIAAMLKHEELPWVTLVTCRGYDEVSNSYLYRVLVRAVLVEVN